MIFVSHSPGFIANAPPSAIQISLSIADLANRRRHRHMSNEAVIAKSSR
jgi:hypothetical protein